MLRKLLLAIWATLSPTVAYAITCDGRPTYTAVENSDIFKIDIGFGQWAVCRLAVPYTVTNATYGTYDITPQTCQALVAQFMTAKSQRTVVRAFISGSGPCPVNLLASNYAYAWLFSDE